MEVSPMHPFFIIARVEAKQLLQHLDARFEPRVYFATFSNEKAHSATYAFLDDDCPFADEILKDVASRAKEVIKSDPESRSFQTDPGLQKQKIRSIRNRAWREALTEVIEPNKANEGYTAFCGHPVEYQDNFVMQIVMVEKSVYDEYSHLTKTFYYDRELPPGEEQGTRHRYLLCRSLIEAVANEYINETGIALGKENPGSSSTNVPEHEQLYLAASRRMLLPAAVAGRNPFGLSGVFDACNTISTLKYEGKEGVGRLVFAKRGHADIDNVITLKNPVKLRSYGAIRKLLQMASKGLSLLCDSESVYGLGKIRNTYDLKDESIFTVQFARQFVWNLLHGDGQLMHVKYGQASLRPLGFPEAKFRADVPRVFSGVSGKDIDRLCEIANSAASQKHGCMLVISPKAADEATRLKTQSTLVEPFVLDDAVMELVTAIDGSVLVDTTGACHAIGVILDGVAAKGCTPERGARYNSAVKYHAMNTDTIIVVKSEDGMFSIFPDLLPQIKRSDLRRHIEALAAELEREKPDPEKLRACLRQLDHRRFYFMPEDCVEVNALITRVDAVYSQHDWITGFQQTFVKNPEMSPAYYLSEVT
jgi:hypothetical protein